MAILVCCDLQIMQSVEYFAVKTSKKYIKKNLKKLADFHVAVIKELTRIHIGREVENFR